MSSDTLEDLFINRVPDIDVRLRRKRGGVGNRLFVTQAGELRGLVEGAQDIDGRRMDLPVNDDVASLRKVAFHTSAYLQGGPRKCRF
jgi:hypothetical protein